VAAWGDGKPRGASHATVPADRLKKVLCLGAHSDDIEIGCGGTLLKLTAEHPGLEIMWVVFSAGGIRTTEARASARAFLRHAAAKSQVIVKDFRTSFFPFEGEEIKQFFETLKPFQPDLVFTHYRDDRHQDHRVLSDLTWNTFRSHVILEYRIPKYDGDLGTPNFFVPISHAHLREEVGPAAPPLRVPARQHWFTSDCSWLCLGFEEWNAPPARSSPKRSTQENAASLNSRSAPWCEKGPDSWARRWTREVSRTSAIGPGFRRLTGSAGSPSFW
jgi:LmbE family N-acetylglucosaminyl deacetylase